MLFACTLVLSRPVGKEGFERETWAIGVRKQQVLGGPKQIRRILMEESSKSFSLTLDWGHEGRISEVLQEDGRSCMYKLWLHNYAVERNSHELFVACYPWLIMIIFHLQARLAILIKFIFRRLKINDNSHEFILECGTVANSSCSKPWVSVLSGLWTL
jgi:hypothetical protein